MAIQWAVTAARTNLSLTDLNALLAGTVHATVAARFGLSVTEVQAFVDGHPHASVAAWLGLSGAAAEELARELGRDGVIGFLVARLYA